MQRTILVSMLFNQESGKKKKTKQKQQAGIGESVGESFRYFHAAVNSCWVTALDYGNSSQKFDVNATHHFLNISISDMEKKNRADKEKSSIHLGRHGSASASSTAWVEANDGLLLPPTGRTSYFSLFVKLMKAKLNWLFLSKYQSPYFDLLCWTHRKSSE